jgi:hypothetical protein
MNTERPAPPLVDAGDAVAALQLVQELRELGPERFAAAHPHPFLVTLRARPPIEGVLSFRTVAVSRHRLAGAPARISLASELCYPVRKTSRNPYSSQITLGRARNNDVIIRMQEVSKGHAALFNRGDDVWGIQDLGSTNGTMVNDERVSTSNRSDLGDGDVLSLGAAVMQFLSVESLLVLLGRHAG